MKIISLTAENIKRLTVVQITPEGNLVQITGKNGQGKTSVLDSIWWALAGTSNIQAAPIRKGATEARITLDLGEIIVRRTFRTKFIGDEHGNEVDGGYTTSITVENADGARYPSPQRMLDGLLGSLSFDPLAFATASAKEQFDALKRFVPDVDFEKIEEAQAADFAARTDQTRRAKDARAQASGIAVPADAPLVDVDVSAIVAELDDAGRANSDYERQRAYRRERERECERLVAKAKEFDENAVELRRQADVMDVLSVRTADEASGISAALSRAEPVPENIDTAAIRARLDAAQAVNKIAELARRRAKHLADADAAASNARKLTASMVKRKEETRAAIALAKLPVASMTFGEGVILMNGVPFEQSSDAEKLRASVAIAMAANPKLRVIRVRDGSLLDDDGIRIIAEMADASDCQVWIERVDSSGKIGFVLEDGHLKDVGREA